jgi:hypothetical protein
MSDQTELPQQVKDFVDRYIDSVAELEALLLLRSSPADVWTVAQLAARLYTEEKTTAAALTALHRRGLLGREGEVYRYAPGSPALRDDVEALSRSYPRFLIRITNVIHSKPRASLREFLDAFRLREDKPPNEEG